MDWFKGLPAYVLARLSEGTTRAALASGFTAAGGALALGLPWQAAGLAFLGGAGGALWPEGKPLFDRLASAGDREG